MKKIILIFCCLSGMLVCNAQEKLESPNGNFVLDFYLGEKGEPIYKLDSLLSH